jgi:hypothetical protein
MIRNLPGILTFFTLKDMKNNPARILLLFFILLVSCLSIFFFNTYRNKIRDKIYTKKSVEIKEEIAYFIKQKQGGTAAITFVISKDRTIAEALGQNDPSIINYDEIIKGLSKYSDYKNIWIQIIDRNGNNFYRSWMKKHGDYMADARKDIALMLRSPHPMNHLSTGKFDMSFKTMLPLYDHGQLIGLIEMITHFNSIAIKLKKRFIEPVLLVEEKYTKQFIKPFSDTFIGNNYVANKNASGELMDKIAAYGIDKFIHIKNYAIIDNNLVTTYDIPDIEGEPMGYGILFYHLPCLSHYRREKNKLQKCRFQRGSLHADRGSRYFKILQKPKISKRVSILYPK